MPSLYDPARRREILARLEALRPGTPARWGKFDAPKMVNHLIESFRMASGELVPRPKAFPLAAVIKFLAIRVLPFPKGAPTARELLVRVPESWDADLATLRARIEEFKQPAPGTAMPPHPAFGPMSIADWGLLGYKHTNHHFRQFGI